MRWEAPPSRGMATLPRGARSAFILGFPKISVLGGGTGKSLVLRIPSGSP